MTEQRRNTIVAGIVVLVAAVVVVASFFVFGSPSTRRQVRLDSERVDRLIRIATAIREPLNDKASAPEGQSLPASLDELSRRPNVWITPSDIWDPDTMKPFEYRVIDPAKYELCAVFSLPTPKEARASTSAFWHHEAGSTCFTFEHSVSASIPAYSKPFIF